MLSWFKRQWINPETTSRASSGSPNFWGINGTWLVIKLLVEPQAQWSWLPPGKLKYWLLSGLTEGFPKQSGSCPGKSHLLTGFLKWPIRKHPKTGFCHSPVLCFKNQNLHYLIWLSEFLCYVACMFTVIIKQAHEADNFLSPSHLINELENWRPTAQSHVASGQNQAQVVNQPDGTWSLGIT